MSKHRTGPLFIAVNIKEKLFITDEPVALCLIANKVRFLKHFLQSVYTSPLPAEKYFAMKFSYILLPRNLVEPVSGGFIKMGSRCKSGAIPVAVSCT
jgi:hypothetical protein